VREQPIDIGPEDHALLFAKTSREPVRRSPALLPVPPFQQRRESRSHARLGRQAQHDKLTDRGRASRSVRLLVPRLSHPPCARA
jgi:hypothetical protein